MKSNRDLPEKQTLFVDFLEQLTRDPRLAESLRYLRTNVEFSFMDKEYHCLMVTSADQSEGKSTLSMFLSHTLAQAGKTVLLIDADLRKPIISRLIPSPERIGLSGILTDVLSADIQAGTLKEYSLEDLMRLIHFRKKTGILHLVQNGEKVDVHFLQGELMDVYWLTRPNAKKLLSLLIQNDVINKEQAKRCIQRQKDTGQKIGYLLLNMGFINQETLAGYIRLHIIEGLRVAMQLHDGTFSFENQPISHFEKPSYHPFKVSQIFEDMIIGKENLPFLQKKIYGTIIDSGSENLSLLPSGPLPLKPSEILGSARMSFLLGFLKDRYDVLVIDSPPVLPTSDPLLLAPQADGVIFVVKAGLLDRKIIQKALENLGTTRANILGVVLNQVDLKKDTYYHYYSKYYGKK
ncbi:MAG: DUF4388 domain-containing protein [Deltaproteobacteria bacterium]|nr:DUF4388 domain-containing protein [Deltaproteobacteria bacterium]